MTATDRARAALARTDGPLPWHALVPKSVLRELLSLAEDGEHWRNQHGCQECAECVVCEDDNPTSACKHGQVLCRSCAPGGCVHCSTSAYDVGLALS
jgi:hypothetical protein